MGEYRERFLKTEMGRAEQLSFYRDLSSEPTVRFGMAKRAISEGSVAEVAITGLPLSTALKNALTKANYHTVESLKNLTVEDLKAIPGLGGKRLIE